MDYDNTNRGVARAPFESQNLLLTGKLDKDGDNKQIAIIQDTDKEGRDVLVIYERVGVMYGNKDADDAKKQPHYSGPIDDNHRIAGWRETDNSGKKYLSLRRSEKYKPQAVDDVSRETTDGMKSIPASEFVKNDIPF
tara:strand:- start:2347 stop:2757 length:411 start_codon:yes stop_codon:yes gene_type:complete